MVEFPKFKGFAEETKLHGIPRMPEGSKLSMSFWSILVIISVAMAIRDLNTLVTTYQSEPTAITMFLAKLPSDFNWTTPTLCMEMVAQYYSKIAGDVSLDFNSNESLSTHMQYYITDLLTNFDRILSTDNYTIVDIGNIQSSNPNFIYYTYMMLGYLIAFEQQLMNQTALPNYQFSEVNNDPLVGEHSQWFFDQFQQRNVSMSHLTQAIGMWYCLRQLNGNARRQSAKDQYPHIYGHMENYRYIGDLQYIDLPMCKADMITYLGPGMVCSKLFETPNVPLRPKYNYFTIYDTRLTLPGSGSGLGDSLTGGTTISTPYAALVPNLQFHLDLQGRNVIPTGDRTNIFSWSPADNVVLDISVSTEYQFLNTKKRSCSDSPVSQNDCVWRNRVDFVHQQCGCWPSLADIRNPKNSRNCTNHNLTNIYNTSLSVHQFCPNVISQQPDLSECIMNCHLYNYSFTQQKSNIFQSYPHLRDYWIVDSGLMFGSFEFRFNTQRYNLITEGFTTDWANFLGVWGGSIGTWLGASLLAFVHIPIYLFRQYCLPKSKANRVGSD